MLHCARNNLNLHIKPRLVRLERMQRYTSMSGVWAHLCGQENEHIYIYIFFFFASGVFIGGPVYPLLRFYCIFHYSIHFDTWMVTLPPSANHSPSCLTSVILRELVFPTWSCRSFLVNIFCSQGSFDKFRCFFVPVDNLSRFGWRRMVHRYKGLPHSARNMAEFLDQK